MPARLGSDSQRAELLDSLEQARAHFIAGSSTSGSEDSGPEGERPGHSVSEEVKGTNGEQGKRTKTGHRSKTSRAAEKVALHTSKGDVTMSARYSRVSTADERSSSSPSAEAENSKRRRSQLAEKISNKLHALFWTVVGFAVAYHTDFVRVLMEDERVARLWFNIGVVCFSINIVILAYLTVWLPYVSKVKVPWNVYCPRAIPTATLLGLICALALNIALWSVWGFLTPLILFAVFAGCLFSLHFVPWPC